MAVTILRGTVVSAEEFGKLNITEGGYLIAEDGIIRGVFSALPEEYQGAEVQDYGDALILLCTCTRPSIPCWARARICPCWSG